MINGHGDLSALMTVHERVAPYMIEPMYVWGSCVVSYYRITTQEAHPANDTFTNPSPSPNSPAHKLRILTDYYISLAESAARGCGLSNAVHPMTSGRW